MEAHAIANEKPFSRSEAMFAALVRELDGPDAAALPHGKLEERLRQQGQELLRVMYEDHLNLRAQASPTEVVIGNDGDARTHRREMPRKLMSIFGPVDLRERTGWRGPGLATLCPIDAELNLPPTIDSHGVRRRVAELASRSSFDTVGEELAKTSGATVGKRQLEELTQEISADFDTFYETTAAKPVDASATLVIGSADSTGIAMRPEALREATRRQREAERSTEAEQGERWPKPKRSSDMRRHGMRLAAVSVVYEIAPHERDWQDILRDLRPVDGERTKKTRPKPQAKRVSAERDQVDGDRRARDLRRDAATRSEAQQALGVPARR